MGKGGDSSHETQDDLMLMNRAEPESPSSSLHCGDLQGWGGALSPPSLPQAAAPRGWPDCWRAGGPGCCDLGHVPAPLWPQFPQL